MKNQWLARSEQGNRPIVRTTMRDVLCIFWNPTQDTNWVEVHLTGGFTLDISEDEVPYFKDEQFQEGLKDIFKKMRQNEESVG